MENYFASNLKKLRLFKKLSQNKLGELVGYNQTTIARWEDKVMSPNIDNVLKFCEYFDVDIATFLGRELVIENGVIINQHYGFVKIPVYDIGFVHTPIKYEEVSEEYKGAEEWIALTSVEDDIPELQCQKDDLIIVSKKEPKENDTVVYVRDYQTYFEPVEGSTILGVVKEVRKVFE